MHWTHFTLAFSDLDQSIRFLTDVCRSTVVRDRGIEGGSAVWLGPEPTEGVEPEFALVAHHGEVKEPLDHFGFQYETRDEVTAIAKLFGKSGNLVGGSVDEGRSAGYTAIVRKASGHLIKFTLVQPFKGLRQSAA